jgi:hypothetical protein
LISKFLARCYQKLRLCAGVIMRAHQGTAAIPAGTVRFHAQARREIRDVLLGFKQDELLQHACTSC